MGINPLIFLPYYFVVAVVVIVRNYYFSPLSPNLIFAHLSCGGAELGYNFLSSKTLLWENKEQSFIQGGVSSDKANTTRRNESFVVVLAGPLRFCA